MDYCYVLFVRTGDEDKIYRILSGRLNTELFQPFVPKKAMILKRLGVPKKIYKKCFPGYVFIQSNSPPNEFMHKMFPIVYPLKEAYRFLHYGDNRQDIALREHERQSLLSLFGESFTIDCVVGVLVGDRVQIVSGAFADMEGTIKKILPRRREVIIEIPFMGDLRPVSLGLDIVERV